MLLFELSAALELGEESSISFEEAGRILEMTSGEGSRSEQVRSWPGWMPLTARCGSQAGTALDKVRVAKPVT